MTRHSRSISGLPVGAAVALSRLGDDLATARKRRHQSLRDWAQELGVSVPTLMRLERGDPAVSAGVYATALWLIGRHPALGELAEPRFDTQALEADVDRARQRYSRDREAADDDPAV